MYLKCIIWISFFVNILFILLEPFSIINLLLFICVGMLLCYYASNQIDGVNFKRMRILWYVYLNILVIVFVIRYTMQFM
jgi:hypothetical protein